MNRALGVLALVAGVSCSDWLVGANPASSNAAIFDMVWSEFDRNYTFFESKHIDWNAAYATYRPRAVAATSPSQLAQAIGDLLTVVRDVHVELYVPELNRTYRSLPFPGRPLYFDPRAIPVKLTATRSGHFEYGQLKAGVGYVRIASFGGSGWGEEIDSVLTALGSISRLVFDLRNNGGGSTSNSEPIFARLLDTTAVLSYTQYRNGPGHGDFGALVERRIAPAGTRRFLGPVVLLTNRGMASAAEDFVVALSARGNVTSYGDTTIGGSSNPVMRELPNGWTYRVSRWLEYDYMKVPFPENVGLAPTIVVKATAADSVAGRDPVIARLLADLP